MLICCDSTGVALELAMIVPRDRLKLILEYGMSRLQRLWFRWPKHYLTSWLKTAAASLLQR